MPYRRRWSPPNEIGKLANPSSSVNSTNSPNSDDNSTVPIADLVREAPTTMPFSNGRCIYFTPPSANSTGLPSRQSPNKGLRRFHFFGYSPQPPFLSQPTNRRPFAPNSSSSLPLDEANSSFASPLAQFRPSAAARGCAFLGTKQRRQNSSNFPLLLGSHSSRTVSLDFDSESTGTTVPAEEILPRLNPPQQQIQRNKCDANKKLHQQNAAFRHSQQQMPMDSPPSADGGHPQRRRAAGPPLNFGGGSQFDAQSLQTRRSRSFAATHSHHQQMSSYPNGSIGGTPAVQQHNSMPMRCGSCSNLSLAGGGLNGGGGQLVLYEGGGQIGNQQPEAMATQRHSMILPMDVGQLTTPIWYQPIPGPPPPPPPFYYTAATLPHPGTTPLDYKAFKYALKESERFEKKQRKMMMAEFGDETFGSACCEFCCGGSALILWLVISLVALGFIGFLLMAIYFV